MTILKIIFMTILFQLYKINRFKLLQYKHKEIINIYLIHIDANYVFFYLLKLYFLKLPNFLL